MRRFWLLALLLAMGLGLAAGCSGNAEPTKEQTTPKRPRVPQG